VIVYFVVTKQNIARMGCCSFIDGYDENQVNSQFT